MKKRGLLVLCFLVPLSFSLWAMDFGVLLDESLNYTNQNSEGSFDYTGSLIPRFSYFFDEKSDLYASMGLSIEYQNSNWDFIPELLRTEFSMGFGSFGFKAGRTYYSDPLGFIAEGLFDGLEFFYDAPLGIFKGGVWYTGLLYKKRANIYLTMEEYESFYRAFEFSEFADTYFAPRRMLFSLGWEHPALLESIIAKAAFLGQFDLNDETSLNSQYLTAKFTVPLGVFTMDLGGSLSFIQDEGEAGISFAAELGASWMPPTSFPSRLSFLGRFTSGFFEDSPIREFLPLTAKAQGEVLKANLSGISILSLGYLARLHQSFSLGLSASSYLRNDKGIYAGYPVGSGSGDDADGFLLGTEFFGRFFWSPFSDLQLSIGGGAFLPSLGNTAPSADPLWRLEFNVIFSVY